MKIQLAVSFLVLLIKTLIGTIKIAMCVTILVHVFNPCSFVMNGLQLPKMVCHGGTTTVTLETYHVNHQIIG